MILLTLNTFGIVNTSKAAPVIRRVPEDYPTIQAAINAANPSGGDTVLVAPGNYSEYVVVNKSVNLQGTNRQSIITGLPSVVRVIDVKVGTIGTFTGKVKISGFTIKGITVNQKGIYVEPPLARYFANINITDNTIIGCNDAIFYSRSSKCFVTNNTMLGDQYGVRLYSSSDNVVSQNFINATGFYGIHFYSRSYRNNITMNTIANGKYGILLEYSNYTTMYLNTVEKNTEYALRFSYTFLSLSIGNTLKNNKWGVYIWNCSLNQFYYNNFIDNTIQQEHYAVPLTSNTWDTNPPTHMFAKGNYWSDYGGVDNGIGVGRWGEPRYALDGVGDTIIPHLGVDWYPLMFPWEPIPPTKPVAIFTWDPIEPIVNLTTTFNATKSYATMVNGTILYYKWYFGAPPLIVTTVPIITHVFTHTGNYTVVLTVVDNWGQENSTTHIIQVRHFVLSLDLYSQQPEPYSGKGPNQPCDAYAPQQLVILYAQVLYNYEPIENKMVAFEVKDPNGATIFTRSANTTADGIASVEFRLATNATFGNYTAFAQVTVSERIANDTMPFRVGWLIEVISVETVDQYGAPKTTFAKGEQIYFTLEVKNIAFTSKSALLTIGLVDETDQVIGVAYLSLTVPPGTNEYEVLFDVTIPNWTLVGTARADANAYTDWPVLGGTPYCPEKQVTFQITA
jgi:parallel beta-helix repeat protein